MMNLAMQEKQTAGELCDLSGMDRLGPYWVVTEKRWAEANRRGMVFAICADEKWIWSIARFDVNMKFHMPYNGDLVGERARDDVSFEEWQEMSRNVTYLIKAGTILASVNSDLYAYSRQTQGVECLWLK